MESSSLSSQLDETKRKLATATKALEYARAGMDDIVQARAQVETLQVQVGMLRGDLKRSVADRYVSCVSL